MEEMRVRSGITRIFDSLPSNEAPKTRQSKTQDITLRAKVRLPVCISHHTQANFLKSIHLYINYYTVIWTFTHQHKYYMKKTCMRE